MLCNLVLREDDSLCGTLKNTLAVDTRFSASLDVPYVRSCRATY